MCQGVDGWSEEFERNSTIFGKEDVSENGSGDPVGGLSCAWHLSDPTQA